MNKEQYIESAEKTFYKTYNRFPVVFERGEVGSVVLKQAWRLPAIAV